MEGARALRRFFEALDRLDERLLALERLDREIARLERAIRSSRNPDRETLAMQRAYRRRGRLEAEAADASVRVLHLGDSHIAADLITRVIRARLQARFGNGGRGLVVADQKLAYGGRRLERRGWARVRMADPEGPGRALGVSGTALLSQRAGAELEFRVLLEDQQVVLHYVAHPEGPALDLRADGLPLARFPTASEAIETRARLVSLDVPPPPPDVLEIRADGPGAEILALSFETGAAGVLYDAIGPVGADAQVWLAVDAMSFSQQARALAPRLVVLMVGGNDALALRRGRRTEDEVEAQLRSLIERLRRAVPEADCLLFGPMDAAQMGPSGRLGTKPYIPELAALERRVAQEEGCAYWDAFGAMGGPGSFGRWLAQGLMNPDLVHPRSGGGDLLGHLFAAALYAAYLEGG